MSQLREQGFTRIQITRTLLGRSRIVATSKTLTREIVINPATGAILRDYWIEKSGSRDGGGLFNPNPDEGDDHDDGFDYGYGAEEGDDDGGEEGDDGGEGGSEGGGEEGGDGGEGGEGGGGGEGGDGDD